MDNNYDYNTTRNTQEGSVNYNNPYAYPANSRPAEAHSADESRTNNYTAPVNSSVPAVTYSNPYSASQYTPNDFKTPKQKRKSGKKWGLSVAAICAAMIIAGGSFYGGVRYAADADSVSVSAESSKSLDSASASGSDKTVSATNTVTVSDDNSEVSSTITEVVENAMPSMVAINTITQESMSDKYGYFYNYFFGDGYDQTYETSASGSGIIIGQNDEELLIVTNNHVIEGANEIAVEFIDGESYDASIKGTAADNDLAVISVKIADIKSESLEKIKVATLGDSTTLKLGEPAIAIGNSLGYGQSVTVGYISATERSVQLSDKTMTLIQTDAAINPGNSGGALLNIKGEVIGINSAKYSDTSVEGTGYAIPITDAQPIIQGLMNSTYVSDEDKPYLGIYAQAVPESYQERFEWPQGVYVTQVSEGSPASLAGLQSGDIITAIDGQEISTMEELQSIIESHSVGDKVTLSVTRSSEGGKTQTGTLTATLISRGDAKTETAPLN